MNKYIPLLLSMTVFPMTFHEYSYGQITDESQNDLEKLDGIHFTVISNTAMTFDWTGTADFIRYGINPNNLSDKVIAVHPELLPVTSPWISDPGPYWEAKLSGLKENTIYYYKIGNIGKIHEFKTPPLPGKADFRVCLTSDMHQRSTESIAMFYQIAQLKPDLVLTTGDITGAGPDGQQEVVSRFHDVMLWSQSTAWMPAWGNHDWEYEDKDDLRTLKGRFDIPNPGTISDSPAISCCGEDWGWFDYGNTRFISIPEPYTSSTRDEWKIQVTPVFAEAQNDPNIKFIITFGHRSAYTSTFRRSPGETDLRIILNDFRANHSKYVLDLSGHNQQYERYQTENGMTYIVNSPTGSYYHEGWESPDKPANCAFRVIHYSILALDFSKNAIRGRLLCSVHCMKSDDPDYMPLEENVCDEPGMVLDSFTITCPKKRSSPYKSDNL
jgi:predicted MPP superfamily phosphohydrolase